MASAMPVANPDPPDVWSKGTRSSGLGVGISGTPASEGGWPADWAVKMTVPPIAAVVLKTAEPICSVSPAPVL